MLATGAALPRWRGARPILSPEKARECLARNLARTLCIGVFGEPECVVYRRPLTYWAAHGDGARIRLAPSRSRTWRLPWRHTELRWLPLRHALETHIIGLGGFVADRVEQQVVEDHVETSDGRGHEEPYLVLHGRATFTLDDVELDAPAGRLLLVDDPGVRRGAIAAEPGTVVFAFGGPPAFEPAASEWIERARAHAATDPGRAQAVLEDLRIVYAGSPAVLVAEAVVAAATGDRTAALDELLELRPELRERLLDDPDIGPLLHGRSGDPG
jgi:hypothetical protein